MELRLLTRLVILLVFIQSVCYAQSAGRQHLQALLREKQAEKKDFFKDTSYIDVLTQLANAYYTSSADSLFLYANQALDYAKQTAYLKGEANALRTLGNGHRLKGNYAAMLSLYQQALLIAEKIPAPSLICKTLINIGQSYRDMNKSNEALPLIERAEALSRQIHDTASLQRSLDMIGEIWYQGSEYDRALPYYQQARQLAYTLKDERGYMVGNAQEAKVWYAKKQYSQALPAYLQALTYFTGTGEKMVISMCATMVARSYLGLKKYPEALKYAHQSLREASELKSPIETKNAYCLLRDIYKAMGNYRQALQYMELTQNLSDTLFNEEMRNKVAALEARYEYEKKEALLKEEQAKKDIHYNAIVSTQRLEIGFSVVIIFFLMVLAYTLYRNQQARQKVNRDLQDMNAKISHQKEAIEAQSLQLLINNQQKDKLFNIISHDLKIPLQSLQTVLDLLKKRALSEKQINQMIEELSQEVDYSSELVRNLLSWSKSQLNGIEVNPVRLQLRELTEEVLHLFKKQAAEKKVGLNNQLNPALAGYADQDMIHVIIRNLVSNAIKFCEAGDTITIDGYMEGSNVALRVTDTGTGIEQQVLNKINRQRMVTTFGTAGERGTGLGLLICQEFSGLNKGSFRAESTPGQGSRFSVVLPGSPAALAPHHTSTYNQ